MKKIKFKFNKFAQINLEHLDDRTLLLNVYLTQLIIFIIGLMIIILQRIPWKELFQVHQVWMMIGWGIGFALSVLFIDVMLARWTPKEVMNDGGLNERLFSRLPLWHIAVIAMVISFSEELLFRGAIQHSWGPYWTSILFTAIHVRYLKHWLLTGLVFCISYGLGWIYEHTGSLWTPVVAHFMIDFILGCVVRYSKEEKQS